ncbi:MAG: terpene cyclase/mutase family protein [Planctomycetes bacterium]|nr:terpene cyclase/mutase family protein [Planctomycetota bacterium]
MRHTRITLALITLLAAASCGGGDTNPRDNPATPQSTLQRACAWLWKQQAADGGWHSETYGLMRSGQSLTPFVLHALLSVPEEQVIRPDGGVEKGLAFIRTHTNSEGCLGRSDRDIADYPNHSTAYAVRCLVAAGNKADAKLIRQMCDYLLAQQFNAANGTDPQSHRWGGWGFGSDGGVMDIGHTRHVLEALHDAASLDAACAERAQSFLRLLQRHPAEWRVQPEVPGEAPGDAGSTYDGGFYFSPTDTAMNKGRHQPAAGGRAAWYRSYATATCDGLLSLLAAGVSETDERVKAAASWLDKHPAIDHPAGIPQDDPTPWYVAVHYYHVAVRAEAWRALGRKGDWKTQIERHLAASQRANGSFVNENSPLMKENDPVLCTALAVVALAHCA